MQRQRKILSRSCKNILRKKCGRGKILGNQRSRKKGEGRSSGGGNVEKCHICFAKKRTISDSLCRMSCCEKPIHIICLHMWIHNTHNGLGNIICPHCRSYVSKIWYYGIVFYPSLEQEIGRRDKNNMHLVNYFFSDMMKKNEDGEDFLMRLRQKLFREIIRDEILEKFHEDSNTLSKDRPNFAVRKQNKNLWLRQVGSWLKEGYDMLVKNPYWLPNEPEQELFSAIFLDLLS